MKLRNGFTLIELIVVIAVIAILVAMLLPVLVAARERVRGIQCVIRERQLYMAWRQYIDNKSERLPYASLNVLFSEAMEDPGLYNCPSTKWSLRLNYFVGGSMNDSQYGDQIPVKILRRSSDLGGSSIFLVTDARKPEGGTSFLLNVAKGWDNAPTYKFESHPSISHNQSASFMYIDGHSGFKRWQDGRTFLDLSVPENLQMNQSSNLDIAWLNEHTVVRK